ncbi:PAS domain-containing protein [Pedobacter sp. CG_S7]|uniref:PAS domain-containing protein n=1 Tax=Pedobacter sp. CG_S7 TaxID=3143930 RepID=UPI00339768E1
MAESCLNQPHTIYEAELETPKQDGGLKFVLWQFMCLTDANGLPSEMQGIGVDVTEHKLAKDAMVIASERNKYVGLITNDAIYDWEIAEDHITWGYGYYRLFGYENCKEKYPLTNWVSQIHDEDVERVESNLNEILADQTKNVWKAEYQFKKGNGSYAYIEENGYIIRDLNGKGVRMIGIMRDIEERKKATDEIKFLHKQLDSLNSTSWIPSNVAREPLNKLMNLVESIEAKSSSENEKAQLVDILQNSANQLNRILMRIPVRKKK